MRFSKTPLKEIKDSFLSIASYTGDPRITHGLYGLASYNPLKVKRTHVLRGFVSCLTGTPRSIIVRQSFSLACCVRTIKGF